MNFDFRFYWSLFLRRLPVMTAMVLVCSALGVMTALNLPPTYQTSARLLVESAQIPDDLAATTVRTDASEQLQVIEQQLLTRANLIDIANKFNVFQNMREMTPDAIVAQMTEKTRIRRTGGRGQATFMTLSFEARSGQIAADVINEYTTLILESANDFRMERAGNTLAFFEQEVNRLATDLDLQSGRVVNFKNENASALPDDLNYRLGRQALLQERLSRLERDRSALTNQRAEIVRIFDATGQINTPEAVTLSPEEQELRTLQQQMSQARAIYSETNPRVVLLQNRIDQLTAQIEARAQPAEATTENPNPEASLLELSLTELDSRMTQVAEEILSTRAELDVLENSIAATSANAIALNALERDYNNIQTRYNSAVNKLNEARIGERIEVSSQGQRISVIEGANVPRDPSGPNRPKIAIAGIGAGLGLAAGFFALLEILNRRIRRPAEMRSRFDIVPIATIPYMETPGQKLRRRSFLVLAFIAVLTGVPAILWYIDMNIMPLEILASRIMDRVGL